MDFSSVLRSPHARNSSDCVLGRTMLKQPVMNDYDVPRQLPARTGKHICTNCLREVEPDEYFSYDLVCGECARHDDYPLASTEGVDGSLERPDVPDEEFGSRTATERR